MPPEYNSQAYWNARFARESHFDWLLHASTVLPIVASQLSSTSTPQATTSATSILHIGCGNSDLSQQLPSILHDGPGNDATVTNVDFSSTVIEGARARDSHPATNWIAVNLLSLHDIQAKLHRPECNPFSFILDKSTSDSIACGDDILVDLPYSIQRSPRLAQTHADPPSATSSRTKVHPIHLLSLHLADLCPAQGTKWLVFSFSEYRFPFLEADSSAFDGLPEGPLSSEVVAAGFPDTSTLWRIEGKWGVDVSDTQVEEDGDGADGKDIGPGGAERKDGKEGGVVHRPPEICWVYVLVRTDVGVELTR